MSSRRRSARSLAFVVLSAVVSAGLVQALVGPAALPGGFPGAFPAAHARETAGRFRGTVSVDLGVRGKKNLAASGTLEGQADLEIVNGFWILSIEVPLGDVTRTFSFSGPAKCLKNGVVVFRTDVATPPEMRTFLDKLPESLDFGNGTEAIYTGADKPRLDAELRPRSDGGFDLNFSVRGQANAIFRNPDDSVEGETKSKLNARARGQLGPQ